MRRLAALAFFLLATAPLRAADDDPPQPFTVDGKRVEPSVHLALAGRPGAPRKGDVVVLGGFPILLKEDGPWTFSRCACERELRWTRGLREVVSAVVGPRPPNARTPEHPVVAEGLLGLRVDGLDDAARDVLRALDPKEAVLALGTDVKPEDVPASVRFAVLDDGVSDAVVARITSARALALEGVVTRKTAAALGGLAELRALSLAGVSGIADVDLVKTLPSLRHLDVSGSEIEDLSAIAAHPALVAVTATCSRAARLPEAAVPALRDLDLIGARASIAAVASLRAANPAARVLDRIEPVLRAAFEVTQLEVRRVPRGWFGQSVQVEGKRVVVRDSALKWDVPVRLRRNERPEPKRDDPKVHVLLVRRDRAGKLESQKDLDGSYLVVETDAAALGALAAALEVERERPGPTSPAEGDVALVLFGARAPILLTLHEGRILRGTIGRWTGELVLTKKSARAVGDWLAARGFDEPRRLLGEDR